MKKAKTKNAEPKEAVEDTNVGQPVARDEVMNAVDAAGEQTPAAVEASPDAETKSPDEETAESDQEEGLRAKVEELENRLLRAKADAQNLHRRSAVERSAAIRYANAELIKSLLGVLDDFERSLAATETSDNLQAVVDGVGLVYQNLIQALRGQGLHAIDALHEPFDPNVHEAIMQQPCADYPAGTVVEEIAKGYRLHDRVIRPTKVVVSKEPDGAQ
jgi:molecular chaperone GrpE